MENTRKSITSTQQVQKSISEVVKSSNYAKIKKNLQEASKKPIVILQSNSMDSY